MKVRVESIDCGKPRTEDRGPRTEGHVVICRPSTVVRFGGFTLIELMLVLVILATLAAIVTPKLTGQSVKAKITAAKTQISQFETALDAFEIDMGRYPSSVEGLQALVVRPTSDSQVWQGPYMNRSVIPLDPWSNEYVYRYPGQYNQDGYDLYSCGPDGRQGGDDDITNWSEEVGR